jgi:hypothetical protein
MIINSPDRRCLWQELLPWPLSLQQIADIYEHFLFARWSIVVLMALVSESCLTRAMLIIGFHLHQRTLQKLKKLRVSA